MLLRTSKHFRLFALFEHFGRWAFELLSFLSTMGFLGAGLSELLSLFEPFEHFELFGHFELS